MHFLGNFNTAKVHLQNHSERRLNAKTLKLLAKIGIDGNKPEKELAKKKDCAVL